MNKMSAIFTIRQYTSILKLGAIYVLRKIVLRDQRDFLEGSREFVVCLF